LKGHSIIFEGSDYGQLILPAVFQTRIGKRNDSVFCDRDRDRDFYYAIIFAECTHAGIVSIDYTRLSGLVEALNNKLRHSPINGDVLAVQTLTLRFHSNGKIHL
jgi:hypothetical protein